MSIALSRAARAEYDDIECIHSRSPLVRDYEEDTHGYGFVTFGDIFFVITVAGLSWSGSNVVWRSSHGGFGAPPTYTNSRILIYRTRA